MVDETQIRKVTRLGKRSFGITIPIDMIRKLSWRERQKVIVSLVRKRLVVKDWKK